MKRKHSLNFGQRLKTQSRDCYHKVEEISVGSRRNELATIQNVRDQMVLTYNTHKKN